MSSEENWIDPPEKEEYVPAVFARNQKEADMYHQLLLDHDIESIIGYEESDESDESLLERKHGLPVLVLESYLDEASEIIADREDQDEFEDEEDDSDGEDEEDEFGDFSPANEDDLEEEDEEEDDKFPDIKKMDFLEDIDDDLDFDSDEFEDIDEDEDY